jgi:Nucleotide modification associated domain 2
MIVWTYVIVVDKGGAPNFGPPATTLTLCKPKIRKDAHPGDVVLAFNGKRLHHEPHSVRWAGVISEVIPLASYWHDPRFQKKKPGQSAGLPDNIYRPVAQHLEQVSNPTHEPDQFGRDVGGMNALIFQSLWYFGPSAPILPAEFGLRMTGGRRGHRRTEIDANTWRQLKRWLDKSNPRAPASSTQRSQPRRCQ